MSLAAQLQEAFQAFQAADLKYCFAQNKRNPGPREVADAMEARAAARAALDEVVAVLRQEEVLILDTLEQAKVFTQFLAQFPDYGNLRRVDIPGGVDERTAARMCSIMKMVGFRPPTQTFYLPD
ncbi:hypothetical protein ACJRO7_001969 [Eucalyptus globulus]|uniref:Uncharacterized protein n=1 Tax=Eucalyptus globulus TaxID=34317 RepID=A0ABD3LSP9_EUCGL